MTKFNSCHLTFCFLLCGKEIKSKIFGIEAIVCFWNINKKKLSHTYPRTFQFL